MIRIFVGYESRQSMAYHVLANSIISRSSIPLTISPLALSNLHTIFDRPRDPLQSTDFSFTRFLIPHLSNYEGWSLYLDCDMVVVDDIAKLWKLRDSKYAIQVVKNNHIPQDDIKFSGEKQTPYSKKNWSSVMLFNNDRCKKLDPNYVKLAKGLDLHQFKWLDSDDEIGALPMQWNYLAGYDQNLALDKISLIHYTNGGPYFSEYKNCEYADIWFRERDKLK
jgi:lipopolysaccharide biosynthesis glycosyltransferase